MVSRNRNKWNGDSEIELLSEETNGIKEIVAKEEALITEKAIETEELIMIEDMQIINEQMTEGESTYSENITERSETEEKAEWNIELIHANEIESGRSEKKVRIAIIDSGIDMVKEITVAGRVNFVPGEDEVSPLYEDSTSHGTSIAGIIAAQSSGNGIKGINSNVEL